MYPESQCYFVLPQGLCQIFLRPNSVVSISVCSNFKVVMDSLWGILEFGHFFCQGGALVVV